MSHSFEVGQIVHGFAEGAFGRDSYACRKIEAVGEDWIVTRNTRGEAEFTTYLRFDPDYRGYCGGFDDWEDRCFFDE